MEIVENRTRLQRRPKSVNLGRHRGTQRALLDRREVALPLLNIRCTNNHAVALGGI